MISLAILKGSARKELRGSLIQLPRFTCGSTSVRKTNWLTQGQEGVFWLSSDSDDDDDEERRRRRRRRKRRKIKREEEEEEENALGVTHPLSTGQVH